MWAISHGLHFGRDIVFTYGPFAFLQTGVYSPGFYWPTLAWSSLVAGWWVFSLGVLFSHKTVAASRWIVMCAAILVIAGNVHALYLAMPFLFLSVVLRHSETASGTFGRWGYGVLSAIVFAMASLDKTSNAPGVIVILLLMGLRFRTEAIGMLALYVVSLGALWLWAGQSISDLPNYLRGSADLVGGYAEAMARSGPWYGVVAYVVGCGLWARLIWLAAEENKRLMLLAAGVAILWVIGKSALVRHDVHALIGASGLLAVTIISVAFVKREHAAGFLIGIALCAGLVAVSYVELRLTASLAAVRASNATTDTQSIPVADGVTGDPVLRLWARLVNRVRLTNESLFALVSDGKRGLDEAWRRSVDRIANEQPLPSGLHGAVDVYSIDVVRVLASGYEWSGRPIVQSYSAYTPFLASFNAQHLSNDMSAPANIVVDMKSIDDRLPVMEDGPSWLEILRRYDPAGPKGEIWHRRPYSRLLMRTARNTLVGRLGKPIPLGKMDDAAVFTIVHVRLSIAGKLFGMLLRPAQLTLRTWRNDGRVQRYRYVVGMGESGFILSPAVDSGSDLAALILGDRGNGNGVVAFGIDAPPWATWMFEPQIVVELSGISIRRN